MGELQPELYALLDTSTLQSYTVSQFVLQILQLYKQACIHGYHATDSHCRISLQFHQAENSKATKWNMEAVTDHMYKMTHDVTHHRTYLLMSAAPVRSSTAHHRRGQSDVG